MSRFTISKDCKTVLDTETRLEWRQDHEPGRYTYEGALAYAEKVGNGWRLPTIDELKSLIDINQSVAKIDPVAFPDCPAEWFWSSSAYANDLDDAWGVYFLSGFGTNNYCDSYGRVRLVRGGQ